MKRVLSMLCVLLGLWSFAGAEEIDRGVMEAVLSAHPGWEIISADQWGDAAAAALAQGDERILCVAEKYNGQWTLTIDNPTALLPGQTPEILMDTDIALYWTYQDPSAGNPVSWRYSAFKRDGVWDNVSCTLIEVNGEGVTDETSVSWRDDGVMWRISNRCDWNENHLAQRRSAYVPAAWLEPYLPLAAYDVNIVPQLNPYYVGSWLSQENLARAAAQLLPDYTFLAGTVNDVGLELFMRRPDGAKVLVGVTSQGTTDDWCVVESTPLPENAFYGYENFTESLYVGGLLVSVRPFADGSWGVDCIWPETAEGTVAYFGRNWVSGDVLPNARRTVGSHPWSDLTAIDWTNLPCTLQQAVDCVDPDGWATVNNPDPSDRLHLREKADKNSASMGKYYNGTPVEVIKRGKTWTQVRILGVEGWMMTRYLAFDLAAQAITPALPDLYLTDDWAARRIYQSPASNAPNQEAPHGESAVIIGVVGDDWYHVWFPELGQGWYMLQNAFTPGNG